MLNPDFRDILFAFSDADVDYLVVGAYAMAAHDLPRATGDIDLWVRASADNARRVLQALAAFGAPLDGITAEDFSGPDVVFQIGLPPRRIDLLTSVDGVTFDEAWGERLTLRLGGVAVPVLSRAHLVRNKRATGRRRDAADADRLEGLE